MNKMSMSEGGRWICCDGEDCEAMAAVPVALHPTRSATTQALPTSEGWLYVVRHDGSRHYCPSCARRLTPNNENHEK